MLEFFGYSRMMRIYETLLVSAAVVRKTGYNCWFIPSIVSRKHELRMLQSPVCHLAFSLFESAMDLNRPLSK